MKIVELVFAYTNTHRYPSSARYIICTLTMNIKTALHRHAETDRQQMRVQYTDTERVSNTGPTPAFKWPITFEYIRFENDAFLKVKPDGVLEH